MILKAAKLSKEITVYTFFDRESYEQYIYKKDLRRNANLLGALMLILFVLNTLISIVLELGLIALFGMDSAFDTLSIMLQSGLISTVSFFFISLIYALIRGLDFAELFPFEKVKGKTLLMMVTVGLTITLLSNYIADLVTQVFGMFGVTNEVDMSYDAKNGVSLVVYFVTVAIIPALVEEFTFRGILMGSLRKYSDALAVIVSAGLFALMHGNFVQIPFTFVGGLMFGYVVVKTNSLLPAILIHFFNNGLSVAMDVLESNQILSSMTITLIWNAILLILTVASLLIVRNVAYRHPDWLKFTDSDTKIPFKEKMKTVCASPTLIVFACVMTFFAVIVLFTGL